MEYEDFKSYIICYTMADGKIVRQCLACFLFLDENHNPDPNLYSFEWIKKYNDTSQELKCKHYKVVTKV